MTKMHTLGLIAEASPVGKVLFWLSTGTKRAESFATPANASAVSRGGAAKPKKRPKPSCEPVNVLTFTCLGD